MKTATFPLRLLAYNIDTTIFILLAVALSFVIEDNLVLYASCAGFILIYHAFCESSAWQATLGKRYTNMKVIDDQGERISFVKALCRVLTKVLSLVILFGGFFMIYFRADRKGLHDLICGTQVVIRS